MTTALLGITCWLGLTAGEPAVSPTEFQSWFRAASHGRLHLPREARRGAQTFRYVFIGGLANEYLPGYFAQSAKELRRWAYRASRFISFTRALTKASRKTSRSFARRCAGSRPTVPSDWS